MSAAILAQVLFGSMVPVGQSILQFSAVRYRMKRSGRMKTSHQSFVQSVTG
jgi:hypothetical protein